MVPKLFRKKSENRKTLKILYDQFYEGKARNALKSKK